MNIKKLLVYVFALVMLVSIAFTGKAFAATNVSISPASGTVGKNFNIAVNVDTGSDEINGISLNVTYEGDVTYSDDTAGNLGCSPVVDGSTAGTVSVVCFINPGDSFSGKGTLVTLSFAATKSGTITFDVEDVDVAGSAPGTASGATLTVDINYTGGDDVDDGSEESLPETGFITDNIFLIVGAIFLIIGVVIAAIPETWNWMTLKKKQEAKAKEKFEDKIRSEAD